MLITILKLIVSMDGKRVAANDPNRAVWIGSCGYWTDNWNNVDTARIPRCPRCNGPGGMKPYGEWILDLVVTARRNELRLYREYVESIKETCLSGRSVEECYRLFLQELPRS